MNFIHELKIMSLNAQNKKTLAYFMNSCDISTARYCSYAANAHLKNE